MLNQNNNNSNPRPFGVYSVSDIDNSATVDGEVSIDGIANVVQSGPPWIVSGGIHGLHPAGTDLVVNVTNPILLGILDIGGRLRFATSANAVSGTTGQGLMGAGHLVLSTDGIWRGAKADTAGTQNVNVVNTPSVSGITRRGSYTDQSGSIASGGVAQTAALANPSRTVITIQNNGTDDLWFNFTTPAVLSQPSFKLTPGASWKTDIEFVTTESISVISATTGNTWTIKEG